MGETTNFIRREKHRRTTIAGYLFAASIGASYIPDLAQYAPALQAVAAVLFGHVAADAGKGDAAPPKAPGGVTSFIRK